MARRRSIKTSGAVEEAREGGQTSEKDQLESVISIGSVRRCDPKV